MTRLCNKTDFGRWRRSRRLAAWVAVCTLLVMAPAVAQENESPPGSQAEQPESPPPPAAQPWLLDALGRWFGDSKTKLDEQFKTTTDVAKSAANAAGQATGVILGLPGARMVIGRERCTIAPNGAPDCAPAANALCRSKGFEAGRGLDINTADKCPTWVWLSGRTPPEGVCVTETYVLRALCQ
jgi:hypothetical protein